MRRCFSVVLSPTRIESFLSCRGVIASSLDLKNRLQNCLHSENNILLGHPFFQQVRLRERSAQRNNSGGKKETNKIDLRNVPLVVIFDGPVPCIAEEKSLQRHESFVI